MDISTFLEIFGPVIGALLSALLGLGIAWLRKKTHLAELDKVQRVLDLAIPAAIQAAEQAAKNGHLPKNQRKARAIEEARKIARAVGGKAVAKKLTDELADTMIESLFGKETLGSKKN